LTASFHRNREEGWELKRRGDRRHRKPSRREGRLMWK